MLYVVCGSIIVIESVCILLGVAIFRGMNNVLGGRDAENCYLKDRLSKRDAEIRHLKSKLSVMKVVNE